ncbi:MAG: response regulator [Candidatus Kerfeldbacteria bacterium]|nr:response regulator [Candidatus Kerfeldbacteria bacterium]
MEKASTPTSASPHVILLVEDERILLNLYTTTLERAGYTVRTAENVAQALEAVKDATPDLILLDLLIPNKTIDPLDFHKRGGFLFFRKIRGDKRFDDTPIIVFTNLDSPDDRKQAKEFRARDFIVKANYSPKDIIAIVEKELQ